MPDGLTSRHMSKCRVDLGKDGHAVVCLAAGGFVAPWILVHLLTSYCGARPKV